MSRLIRTPDPLWQGLGWLLLTALTAISTLASERLQARFLGVVPGVTSQEQLEKNERWGKPLYRTTHRDGTEWLEYRIKGWTDVIAVMKEGRVQVIDLTPAPYHPQELAEPLGLGQLRAIGKLPSSAELGQPVPADWRMYECSKALVIVFTANDTSGEVVKRLRFYANPPTAVAEAIDQRIPAELAPFFAPLEAPETSSRNRTIAKLVAATLPTRHLTERTLGSEITARTLDIFLSGLDPRKLYFEQRDVDSFAADRDPLADALKNGDLSLADKIITVYRERIGQRGKLLMELLQPNQLVFSEDDDYELDAPDTYAASESELRDRWRRHVKYLVLVRTSSGSSPEEARDQVLRSFRTIQNYWDGATQDDVAFWFLDSLARAFDPHSRFVSPKDEEAYLATQRQQLVGIGAELRQENGFIVISRVLPGGPAALDGRLQPGTRIIGVSRIADGKFEDVIDASVNRVVELIRGKVGVPVALRVLPSGASEPATYTLKRGTAAITSVTGTLIPASQLPDSRQASIGYLRIPVFYRDVAAAREGVKDFRSSAADVRDSLLKFAAANANVVVLDLRGNSGGPIAEATTIAGMFLDGGPVAQSKDRDGKVQVLLDPEAGAIWSGPLVVLTDTLTLGGAEVVAAAIRDRGRGLLVGDDRTFGTGVMCETLDLGAQVFKIPDAPRLGMLVVTHQQLYRITGDSLQLRGVAPHVVLPTETALRRTGEETLNHPVAFNRIPAVVAGHDFELPQEVVRLVANKSAARQQEAEYFRSLTQALAAPHPDRISLRKGQFAPPDQHRLQGEQGQPLLSESGVVLNAWLKESLTIALDYSGAR